MQPILPDSFPSLRVRWDRRLVLGFHERAVAMLTRFGIWRMSRAGDLVSLVSRVPRRLSHLRRSGRSTRCLNRSACALLPPPMRNQCPLLGVPGNAIENTATLPPDLRQDLQHGRKGPWLRHFRGRGTYTHRPAPKRAWASPVVNATALTVAGDRMPDPRIHQGSCP